MSTTTTAPSKVNTDESGFAIVAFIAVLLPLVGLAGAAMLAMGGRSNDLLNEVRVEKALLAAEAGIDEARFRAANSLLYDGVAFARTLPGGASFTVEPTHLLHDSVNNDGDAQTDEADEDVFQLIVTGEYGKMRRRFAAYLSPEAILPIESAVTVHHSSPDIDIGFVSTGFITGTDTNMDGSPGPKPSVPGLAIQQPGTVIDLTSNYNVDDDSRITGAGSAPSHGVSTSPLDLTATSLAVQANATITLGGSYTGANWGSGPIGPFHVIHRSGDLTLDGTVVGAGIMVVTGNLVVRDSFTFDGVLIALDDVNMADNIVIRGAFIHGPSDNDLTLQGPGIQIAYPSEAIQAAANALGVSANEHVLLTGWQEIARN